MKINGMKVTNNEAHNIMGMLAGALKYKTTLHLWKEYGNGWCDIHARYDTDEGSYEMIDAESGLEFYEPWFGRW